MPSLIARRDRSITIAHQTGSLSLDSEHPSVAFEVLADGRILTASGQLEQLLGLSPSEVRGLEVERLLAPEDRARFATLVARAATSSSGDEDFTLMHGEQRVPCCMSWWATDRAPGEGRLRAFFTQLTQIH